MRKSAPALERTQAGLQYLLPGLEPVRMSEPATVAVEVAAEPPAPAPASNGRAKLRSYFVTCPSDLVEAAQALERDGTPLSQTVRAVVQLVHPAVLDSLADPGEPASQDRRVVGKRRVKPGLRLRLPEGLDKELLRRAIAFAVAVAGGEHRLLANREIAGLEGRLGHAQARATELAEHLGRMAFDPFPGGIRSRAQALHVLGFPPETAPDEAQVSGRFRAVAPIYHPDTGAVGSHVRMVQLIEARKLLLRGYAI